MKTIKRLGILLVALAVCSCNSWLDVKHIDQSEESDLFSTERGFTEALAGVYYNMSDMDMYGQTLTYGTLDIMSRTYDYMQIPSAMKVFRDYEYEDQVMESTIYNIWFSCYSNIAALNNILEWSERNASVLGDERRDQVRGEALGLRALLHFDLYRLFAPDIKQDADARILPYQLDFGVVTPPVYSTRDFLELVVKDLTDAIAYLEHDPIREVVPYEWGNGADETKDEADLYVARMNYYAAKALLARVYLDMGGEWKKEARCLAEEVIESKKFALLDYEKSLNTEIADRDLLFSDEHIFSLRNEFIKVSATNLHGLMTTMNGNIQMAQNYQGGLYEGDLDDFRLNWYQTVFIVKYNSDNSERFYPKVPMIRLSEMYLIAAEAWMEDDPGKASEWLRIFKQARTKNTVVAQPVDEEVIIREIRKEFIGEGQIFYAYKRLHHDIIGNTSEDGMKADNSIFVLPLPRQEIEYGHRN